MSEDASLDDFLDAADGSSDEAVTDDETDQTDAPDEATTSDAEATPSNAETAVSNDEATASDDAVAVSDDEIETEATERDAAQSLAPAESVCVGTPDGADCEACDAVVARRWRDDRGFVCSDCRDW